MSVKVRDALSESGLASAEWYHTEIPRKVMKDLMQRTDGPAIRDTIIWLGVIALSAAGGICFWGTWWCVPFFFVYGVLYGSASDSRWHECSHGTAFKTRWMNDVVYQIASFMLMRNPVTWRWSHARHHTDTIIVGRDAEIAVMRPPDLLKAALMFTGFAGFPLFAAHPLSQRFRASRLLKRRATFLRWSKTRPSPLLAIMSRFMLRLLQQRIYMWSFLPLDADRPAAHLWQLAHGV